MSTEIPSGMLYTREHEWARVDGEIATFGITKFAADHLGDITQVDLPKAGEKVTKDEVFGAVESVKAASDLFAPLSGTVVKVNDPVIDNPGNINEEPYDEGWLIQVRISAPDEQQELMSAAEYSAFVAEQSE